MDDTNNSKCIINVLAKIVDPGIYYSGLFWKADRVTVLKGWSENNNMINSLLPDISLHLGLHSFSFVPLTKCWILDLKKIKKIHAQCVYFISNCHDFYSLIEVWLTNKKCIHGKCIMWCSESGIYWEVLSISS